MSLSLAEKKMLVGGAAFVAGVLWLRRALAAGAKGDVFIDRVTVEKTEYTPEDARNASLAALQRQAMEDLGVDLDLMAPTRKPTPMQILEVEDAARKLTAAGRGGEAEFLMTLLRQAEALPPRGNA